MKIKRPSHFQELQSKKDNKYCVKNSEIAMSIEG